MARGGGHLVIENCFVSGFSVNGIWVVEEGSRGMISNCDIQYNSGCGISVHKKAAAVVLGNYVHENGSGRSSHGMQLGPGVDASVFRNCIVNNVDTGLAVDHSTVRIESNIISNHSAPQVGTGVYVTRKGNVTLRSNIIFKNAFGIFTQDGAGPTVTENEVNRCDTGCFSKTQSASKTINNVFKRCGYGAQYYFESAGVLAKNTFEDCSMFPVMVAENSRPELDDNTYTNCGFGMPSKEKLEEIYSGMRKARGDFIEI